MRLFLLIPSPLQVMLSAMLALGMHALLLLLLFGPFDFDNRPAKLIKLPPSIGVQMVAPPPTVRPLIFQPPATSATDTDTDTDTDTNNDNATAAEPPPSNLTSPDVSTEELQDTIVATTSDTSTLTLRAPTEMAPSLLDELVAEHEQELQGRAAAEQARSHAVIMVHHISNHWSRPLSARQGMSVRVRIRMVPSGELVGVSLLDGSGDAAFDRSAIQAIQKAAPLPVPGDEALFEAYFRSMQLVFSPDDL